MWLFPKNVLKAIKNLPFFICVFNCSNPGELSMECMENEWMNDAAEQRNRTALLPPFDLNTYLFPIYSNKTNRILKHNITAVIDGAQHT